MIKRSADFELRLQQDEWVYLINKYRHVAFNLKPDRPRLDGFFPKMNLPTFGFRHLLQLEPFNEIPEQWDSEILSQFDSVITWNSKFFLENKHRLNLNLIQGCTFFNNFYEATELVSYDNKINGICCINKLYTKPDNRGGHIVPKRKEVMENLTIEPMVKHVFAPSPWGGSLYQGPTDVYKPGHQTLLNLISKYKFRLCFESLYHEYWSWDFMTDRMFDCFKAKTVPIYWGCYNIEQHVPKELFIDYRDFKDIDELSKYLLSFSREQYIRMTEDAFEWNKTNRIGSVEDLEKILVQLN